MILNYIGPFLFTFRILDSVQQYLSGRRLSPILEHDTHVSRKAMEAIFKDSFYEEQLERRCEA